MVGAGMLGVGAILLNKTRADDHWSTSPKVEIVDMIEDAAESGDPPTSQEPPRLPAAA